jgi:hypothetical protein
MTGLLTRTDHLRDRTLGLLDLLAGSERVLRLSTLELAWVDADADGRRDRSVSRIAPGTYHVRPHDGHRYRRVWLVDAPDITAGLIHQGNYPRHTRGCILVGLEHRDIDYDGILDVSLSRRAVAAMRHAETLHGRLRMLTVRDTAPAVDAERIAIKPLAPNRPIQPVAPI